MTRAPAHARKLAIVVVLALPSVWAVACSDDHAAAVVVADANESSAFMPSASLGHDAGLPPEASAPGSQALLRVAHLSPDLPAIDVCIAPRGTQDFQGPVLARAFAADGRAVDLAYGTVSGYVSLPIGEYDVRIVAAGSPACAVESGDAGDASAIDSSADAGFDAVDPDAAGPDGSDDAGVEASSDGAADADAQRMTVVLVPDITGLPALTNHGVATLLIAGEVTPLGSDHGFTVSLFADDAVLTRGGAALRAVNAVPSTPVLDFGLGSVAGGWVPLFVNVAFGKPGATAAPGSGAIDPNGYLPIAPLSAQIISARTGAAPTNDTAIAKAAELPLGSIATVFAIGGKTGDSSRPRALLVCIDNAPVGSPLADCTVSP